MVELVNNNLGNSSDILKDITNGMAKKIIDGLGKNNKIITF